MEWWSPSPRLDLFQQHISRYRDPDIIQGRELWTSRKIPNASLQLQLSFSTANLAKPRQEHEQNTHHQLLLPLLLLLQLLLVQLLLLQLLLLQLIQLLLLQLRKTP